MDGPLDSKTPGVPVLASKLVRRGSGYVFGGHIMISDLDAWVLYKYGEVPYFTRHMPGVIEAERDRRAASKVYYTATFDSGGS